LKNCFAECFTESRLSDEALPSVFYLALGKAFFAERPKKTLGKASSARQRSGFR
jgi:hypothetical protein